MLYPTFNQPMLILFVALSGLFAGLLFDISNFIIFPLKKKKIASQILHFVAVILGFGILFLVNLKFNYGQFRIFVLIEFLFILSIERFTLGILWTKALEKCYNNLRKVKFPWKKKTKANQNLSK